MQAKLHFEGVILLHEVEVCRLSNHKMGQRHELDVE